MKTTTQKAVKADAIYQTNEFGERIFNHRDQNDIDDRFGVNRHKNRKEDPRRRKVQKDFTGEVSLTKQEFMAECDVNNIVNRHKQNGTFEELQAEGLALSAGRTADLTTAPDFEAAQNILASANAAYRELPAIVRERFGSPAKFLEFVHMENTDEKIAEGVRLGLWTKVEAPAPSIEAQTLETLKGIKETLNAPLSGGKGTKKDDR